MTMLQTAEVSGARWELGGTGTRCNVTIQDGVKRAWAIIYC